MISDGDVKGVSKNLYEILKLSDNDIINNLIKKNSNYGNIKPITNDDIEIFKLLSNNIKNISAKWCAEYYRKPYLKILIENDFFKDYSISNKQEFYNWAKMSRYMNQEQKQDMLNFIKRNI